jgi:hypothetical protein
MPSVYLRSALTCGNFSSLTFSKVSPAPKNLQRGRGKFCSKFEEFEWRRERKARAYLRVK